MTLGRASGAAMVRAGCWSERPILNERRVTVITGTKDGALLAIGYAGWGVKSDGHVECPGAGYFFLIEVPEHPGERAELRAAVFEFDEGMHDDMEAFDALRSGWYVLNRREDGSVMVTECDNRDRAEQMYRTCESVYADWMGE